jgi:plasmid maintenance system antidote protein VapI
MNQRHSAMTVGQDVTDACNKMIEEVFPDLHQGSAIRGLRLREGLTQEQLAHLLGVKRPNLSEMENGKRPIGKNMAKRLAQVLKTDYKVFL